MQFKHNNKNKKKMNYKKMVPRHYYEIKEIFWKILVIKLLEKI
jgi:hypothetical protein